MSGRESRKQAKVGVNLLDLLACNLVVSQPDPGEDYNGWDFLLQEEAVQGASPFALLHDPAYFSYYFQVKTVKKGSEAHRDRREKILLDHCVRASKDQSPWFLFVVVVGDKNTAEDAYLIHFGEPWIRKTATCIGAASSETGRLPKRISISWTNEDCISISDREEFIAALHRYCGTDPHTYAAHKQSLWRENIALEPQANPLEPQANPLEPRATVEPELNVQVSYPEGAPTATVNLRFYREAFILPEGARRKNQIIIRNLPITLTRNRLLIHAPGVRFLVPVPGSPEKWELSLNLSEKSGLESLLLARHVEWLWNNSARRGSRFGVEVEFGESGRKNWHTFVGRPRKIDAWRQAAYQAIEDLFTISDFFKLGRTPNCDLAALLRQRDVLSLMAKLISDRNCLSFAGECRIETTRDEFTSFTPFSACLEIGSMRAIFAGVIGRRFWRKASGSNTFGWASTEWRVLHEYGGSATMFDDELPAYVAAATVATAELDCCLARIPIVELEGFVMRAWPVNPSDKTNR